MSDPGQSTCCALELPKGSRTSQDCAATNSKISRDKACKFNIE